MCGAPQLYLKCFGAPHSWSHCVSGTPGLGMRCSRHAHVIVRWLPSQFFMFPMDKQYKSMQVWGATTIFKMLRGPPFLVPLCARHAWAGYAMFSSCACDREVAFFAIPHCFPCLLYTSPSPRDQRGSRMPSSA